MALRAHGSSHATNPGFAASYMALRAHRTERSLRVGDEPFGALRLAYEGEDPHEVTLG